MTNYTSSATTMFEGEKSTNEFVRKYGNNHSANKCNITTIGYIGNVTNKCDQIVPMDVTNTIFAFYFGIKTSIKLRYFHQKLQLTNTSNVIIDTDNHNQAMRNQFIEYEITLPIECSLYDIWVHVQKKIKILNLIKLPVFTLITTTSVRDQSDVMYFGANMYLNQYDYTYYTKPNFAKLLYHKMSPMKAWKLYTQSYDDDVPYIYRTNTAFNNRSTPFYGNPILCVEGSTQLPDPHENTLASSYADELKKYSTLYIDDYTQINYERNEEHTINNIGSSNIQNVECRKLAWKIPKGTTLERFFEIVRTQCHIENNIEIRAFRLYEKEKYIITFPYKFQCKEHKLMLERGRYPKYTEVFLMVCLINANNTTTDFLPLIIDKSKSIKFLKQSIMKLNNLNPLEYKKYICYNITTSVYQKDKCWRDSLTLNSNQINPRHGDRIGIQIGVDIINKKISIIKDTRNLNKMWDLSQDSKTNNFVKGSLNPYIQQEIGTISVEDDCNLEQLRKQIYDMEQFKNGDIKSHKYLLLSWLDNIYNIPLSFPMLQSGKLNQQKNFTSTKSIICVEILNEEIELIPKKSRFLHFHLAKIDNNNYEN
eukprot:532747_1